MTSLTSRGDITSPFLYIKEQISFIFFQTEVSFFRAGGGGGGIGEGEKYDSRFVMYELLPLSTIGGR